jgi:hypothetical protein
METVDRTAPHARDEGLVIHELPDETLVYDLKRHRAHSLNRTAAWIWRRCDGRTSVNDLAVLMERELKLSCSEEAVWLALNRLGRAHLLRHRMSCPPNAVRSSRRALVRHLMMAGGLALVTSIVAPEAAHAASACASQTPVNTTQCAKATCASGKTCKPNANSTACQCQ